MRGLFDTKKEHKSIKLVKKLQEEADKEWEKEVQRRKEQELNDEAIAKELQAQLEQEQRQAPSTTLPTTRNDSTNPFVSSPPPLPTKPRAYNSASNVTESSSNNANLSTNSLPTNRNSISIRPLYGLSNASSSTQPSLPPRQHQEEKKPVKSYLNSVKRYQPELQFTVASPTPEPSSVFYSKTPVMSNITPLHALNSHQFTSNTPSKPVVMQPTRPTTAPPAVSNTSSSEPVRNHMAMPVPIDVSPYKPITTSSNNNSAPSSFNNNNRPLAINVTNPQPSAPPPPFSPQKSDPIVLPLSQNPPLIPTSPYNNHHHHNNELPVYFHNSNANPVSSAPATHTTTAAVPYYHQQIRQDTASPGVSLPLNTNNIVHNASSFHNQSYPPQQSTYPPKPPITSTNSSSGFQLPPAPIFASDSSTNQPTSMPLNKQDQQQQHQLQRRSTNPYLQKKPLFSNSVLTLKPDEEQPKRSDTEEEDDDDDWDNIPVVALSTKNRTPTPIPTNVESDDESEVDYSDMIYDRRNEPEEEVNPKEAEIEVEVENESGDDDDNDDNEPWQDPAVDPFADNFAVHVPKASTATSAAVTGDIKSSGKMTTSLSNSVQILDPTLTAVTVSRKKSTNKVATEENELKKEDKVAEEHEQRDAVVNGPHQYEEKESEEIEVRPPLPPQHARSRSSLGNYLRPTDMATPAPIYQHQHQMSTPAAFYNQSTPSIQVDLLSREEQLKVYPDNILKAGAPPPMSANNPYNKKQQAVPASDYGYYSESHDPINGKSLPDLPSSSTTAAATKKDEDVDRHITVASINPGQRVWIRIHPRDTGKLLAERIHIVASYQTRRVTKITTKNGRNIPLDNSPLFDDWNEILNFQEGESWKVEWVPVESPYVDIITDTKEFMKQLKANFRGTSSSAAASS